MHELPYYPPDNGSCEGTPLFPFRPTLAENKQFGRCLRPALYSSLRSSPSHPAGVSALRVTIAIASTRFARKRWELRKSTARSRRLLRNESPTSRHVRARAIGGSTA